MPSELAYKIANDVIMALFTNGAKQKASRLVLELENGSDGGGWSMCAAHNHIADVIEKHIASMGAVEQMRAADGEPAEPFTYKWHCSECNEWHSEKEFTCPKAAQPRR